MDSWGKRCAGPLGSSTNASTMPCENPSFDVIWLISAASLACCLSWYKIDEHASGVITK